MSEKKVGQKAVFPSEKLLQVDPDVWEKQDGITLLEYAAVAAMQGMLSRSDKSQGAVECWGDPDSLAHWAVDSARALCARLEEEQR